MSPARALEAANRLGYNSAECSYFADLVLSQSARSEEKRKQAENRLVLHREKAGYDSVSLDQFKTISDWYHFAILESLKTKFCKGSVASLAAHLDISKDLVKEAINRLCRLGFLRKIRGKLKLSKPKIEINPNVPSISVQHFHRQMLEKATDSLYMQSIGEREFANAIVAIDSSRIGEAKAKLRQFTDDFLAEFAVQKKADDVYGFGLHFFRLTHRFPDKTSDYRDHH